MESSRTERVIDLKISRERGFECPSWTFYGPKEAGAGSKGGPARRDLVRWAMKAEEIAAKFYTELENMVEDEKKKRLMRYLSDMEWGHYYNLKAEYELLLDWAMYDQMMHVGP